MSLLEDAAELQEDLVRLRRHLHAEPEVGLDLPRTQEKVLRALESVPLEVSTGSALTSVVGVIRGTAATEGAERRTVLLRADMDALPLPEKTGLGFASRFPGAAHACGHDLHTAMLVGAAQLLADRREQLAGDVILMFQPGEEGHDGARLMLEEGLLDAAGRRPDAAFALHVGAASPVGGFGARPGVALAASGTAEVVFRGSGGHGAWPHAARDPIPALCAAVGALQTMVTRRFDALEPVLVSVGQISAGSAPNIVPDTARLTATLRALGTDARDRLAQEIERVCHGIAHAHGVEAEVVVRDGYPITVNDEAEVEFAGSVIAELFGPDRFVRQRRPALVADDIGRVLARVPGVMVSLGACPAGLDPERAAPNHAPTAVFDDGVLAAGAATLAEFALRRTSR
ncbi:M20 metallopeptidase family protein [Actinospica robiniae]|uniref:M20 metallopeptidase family protein n=1 Tax=Actinospica robiniae TaxID=304901 RepID=UPI0003F4C4FE|nr:M20 family metallopeptidase [Actinospica robiniae]